MKLKLGFALGLLAGCTVPSGAPSPKAGAADQTAPVAGGVASGVAGEVTGEAGPVAGVLLQFARGNRVCLGVEYLPPPQAENQLAREPEAPQAEIVQPPPLPTVAPREFTPFGGRERERHTWTMSIEDLAATRNPVERETLRFIDDLMGEDRRRLRRQIGTPILTMQATDMQSPGIDLHAEELQSQDEAEWLSEHGVDLLRRPLQLLARRLPLVQEFEADLDDWKETNLPLSEEYGRSHGTRKLGRVSLRLHAGNLADPVEFVYMRSGLRIGTSQTQLKLGFTRNLTRDVSLDVRARQNYDDQHWAVRADLGWALSPRTSLHLVAGDNMDFMATSTVYSLFESPMDGTPGLLLYAVHLF